MNWIEAENNLKQVIESYQELLWEPRVNVVLSLTTHLYPLVMRYKSGERSSSLYAEMIEAH